MNKEDVVHMENYILKRMKILKAIKKNEIVPFAATWMDPEIIIESEVSQRQTNVMIVFIYKWSLKNDKNKLFFFFLKTETDTQKTNLCLLKEIAGR